MRLRGEERLEDPLPRLVVHPATVVGNLEERVRSRRQRYGSTDIRHHFMTLLGAGANVHIPFSILESVGGVDDQVHDHLAHLGYVGLHGGQVGRQPVVDARLLEIEAPSKWSISRIISVSEIGRTSK